MTKKSLLIITVSLILCLQTYAQEKVYDNEIGLNYGTTFFSDDEVSTYNLDYKRFINPHIGIRSGIVFYGSEFMNAGWGLKVPIYAALSTSKGTGGYDSSDEYNKDDSFLETIIYSIISIIPADIEVNAGPSFGYISPTGYAKRMTDEHKSMNNQYYPHNKIAISLDANVRLTFLFNRVGIALSGGGGYWLTKNFKYHTDKPYNPDEGKTIRWNGQIQVGVSYKF